MFWQRLPLYFAAVAAMTIAATIIGEILLVQQVVEHSRRADLRLANGAAHHVSVALEEGHRSLLALLAALPFESGEEAVLEQLARQQVFMFERGGVFLFSEELWGLGASRSPGGPPPRQVLLPALRAARETGDLAVTSLWWGADGKPRVCLVAAETGGSGWHAAVGSVRVDETAFLRQFGFVLSEPDVRLQILDGEGVALFSTLPGERYRSVVHGTYLVDRVRQGESTQLQCHACHEGPGRSPTRENEISTLAPIPRTRWSVLLRENSAAMQEMLGGLVTTVVALVCLILGTFTGFYWLLTRHVVGPLRQLALAAVALDAAAPANDPPSTPADECPPGREEAGTSEAPGMAADLQPAGGSGLVTGSLGEADAAPGELRERLSRALTAAVEGFGRVRVVSALVVVIEGEAVGDPPLRVGNLGPDGAAAEESLLRARRGGELSAAGDFATRRVDLSSIRGTDTLYRTELRAIRGLRGEVWVGTSDPGLAKHLKPIAVLIMLHVQAVLDRSLLSNTLWHEYRQKTRLLGHLFEAEVAERKRIAREIHDDTAQALTALLLLLETFPVGGTPAQQAQAVRTAQERVAGIFDSTDRIMKSLRPALLDDLGLVDAVRALGDDVLAGAGLDFEFDADDEDFRAAPEIEDAIFRVFQEAASNVVRHAQAAHVSASLELADGQIVVSFQDDGRGMQQPLAEDAGDRPRFGLLGMRERIRLLGGTFRVSSPGAGGLRLDVAVPYRTGAQPRPRAQEQHR